jgi:hypothetical protein
MSSVFQYGLNSSVISWPLLSLNNILVDMLIVSLSCICTFDMLFGLNDISNLLLLLNGDYMPNLNDDWDIYSAISLLNLSDLT